MPIITADQTRTRLATPLTADQLDSKYGLVQGLITTAADEHKYEVTVRLGSDDQAEFTSWVRGYGYRVLASLDAGTQIRKVVGTAVDLKITWVKVTAALQALQVVAGNPIYVNLTSAGVGAGTVYWSIVGTLRATDILENTLTGTATMASDGTAAITLNTISGTSVGRTAQIKIYWDSQRTDLIASTATVNVVAFVV
jgi:hypothetical protein